MALRSALPAALLLGVATASAATGDTPGPRGRLIAAQAEAARAVARSQAFEAEAQAAENAAMRARALAVAAAAEVQAAEAQIAVAQARVEIAERLRVAQRARLAARQGAVLRLAAALATVARRPPALALARPGTLADMVHAHALLAATLPAVRARTAGLRADLDTARRLEGQAQDAVAALRAGQSLLQARRLALVHLEGREHLRSASLSGSAEMESERALALGEQARDIADLLQVLEGEASVRARLLALPGPQLRPAVPGEAPPPPERAADPHPPAPVYRLPVVGRVVTGLGEIDRSGVRSRGLAIAAADGAVVVAPAPGRVSYAGPFRTYRSIVIVDHGGGWTTLVTNLARATVSAGDTVDRGSPIGTAAGDAAGVGIELRHGGQPADILRLAAPI